MTLRARPLPAARIPQHAQQRVAPNATLLARDDVTDSLGVFTIQRDEPLAPYVPGQYVSVGIVERGVLVQRPYSIASLSSNGRTLELLVKRIGGGSFSPRLWDIAARGRLRVGPARGLFTVDLNKAGPRVFVGAGTGIAPVMAMLDSLRTSASGGETVVIHAASHASELYLTDRIHGWLRDGLAVDYRPSVSRPESLQNRGWQGLTGRAEAQLTALLAERRLSLGDTLFYVCGNPEMIQACSAVLATSGIPAINVLTEQFHVAATARSAA